MNSLVFCIVLCIFAFVSSDEKHVEEENMIFVLEYGVMSNDSRVTRRTIMKIQIDHNTTLDRRIAVKDVINARRSDEQGKFVESKSIELSNHFADLHAAEKTQEEKDRIWSNIFKNGLLPLIKDSKTDPLVQGLYVETLLKSFGVDTKEHFDIVLTNSKKKHLKQIEEARKEIEVNARMEGKKEMEMELLKGIQDEEEEIFDSDEDKTMFAVIDRRNMLMITKYGNGSCLDRRSINSNAVVLSNEFIQQKTTTLSNQLVELNEKGITDDEKDSKWNDIFNTNLLSLIKDKNTDPSLHYKAVKMIVKSFGINTKEHFEVVLTNSKDHYLKKKVKERRTIEERVNEARLEGELKGREEMLSQVLGYVVYGVCAMVVITVIGVVCTCFMVYKRRRRKKKDVVIEF